MHLPLSVSKTHIYTHTTYRHTLQGGLTLEDMIGSDRCMGENSLHKVKQNP